MELRQLAVVVAVAEEGGFTAAAHRLRTVQSTVSTVVRALERDLGAPLFHRTTHRVELTPAGEAFLPAARAALEAAARARAAVSPVNGQVRLGVCPGLLADWHRVLATLRHVHPGLAVEVRQVAACDGPGAVAESTVDAVLTADADGALDTAARPSDPAPNSFAAAGSATPGLAEADPAAISGFASCAGPFAPGLAVTPLPGEELVLATAPGGSPSAPADLSELSLVDFPAGWAIREAVDRAFPRRRLSLEVDDLAVAAGLLRAGLAACVLPASAAARFPDLTVRRFDRPPAWQLGVVHRGDVSPAVAALLAQLG
ncbi:DNA-binding transcriptional regulator, LysR family [Amycolatopsis pretoriensis]|uniref:DNA-binding transcriptional regulator, LysR family n=1 Tax=Amycolatopsis pretoriensis TaxID=218821 RepID=A0A1H5Q740_9PSEU|nr:LysR family transcriptional regulator [Amycolatopsis pretoriensis]SEF21704.1 DNA-binding transcriptional regulator, LysR family [Amycolatopsis pretoriensis]